jgi:hypothetical protein
MESSNPSSRSAIGICVSQMSGYFISVSDALMLILQFQGNKQEVIEFIGNGDTAFAVINSKQETILYKFVLTRISGEPTTAISLRNLDSWTEFKEFLRNTYIKNRTLECHPRHFSRRDKERTSE